MSYRILIVEDEAAVLAFAQAVLQRAGNEVFTARSVREANLVLEAHKEWDELCLLVDVVMEESGIDFAQKVISEHPSFRVLLMSGFTDDIVMTEPQQVARIAFLRKPFTKDSLVQAVEAVCLAGA